VCVGVGGGGGGPMTSSRMHARNNFIAAMMFR
jgi:hypothetical protein